MGRAKAKAKPKGSPAVVVSEGQTLLTSMCPGFGQWPQGYAGVPPQGGIPPQGAMPQATPVYMPIPQGAMPQAPPGYMPMPQAPPGYMPMPAGASGAAPQLAGGSVDAGDGGGVNASRRSRSRSRGPRFPAVPRFQDDSTKLSTTYKAVGAPHIHGKIRCFPKKLRASMITCCNAELWAMVLLSQLKKKISTCSCFAPPRSHHSHLPGTLPQRRREPFGRWSRSNTARSSKGTHHD